MSSRRPNRRQPPSRNRAYPSRSLPLPLVLSLPLARPVGVLPAWPHPDHADPAYLRACPCDAVEARPVTLWIVVLLLILVLFEAGITMHILWTGAAALQVIWILGFGRTCRSR